MRRKLILYGAGHTALTLAYRIMHEGRYPDYEIAGLIDDSKEGLVQVANSRTGAAVNIPVIGKREDLPRFRDEGLDSIVVFLLKDPVGRLKTCEELDSLGFKFPSILPDNYGHVNLGKGIMIDDNASLFYGSSIGDFSVVGPQVVIEGGARIGRGVVLCPQSFIGSNSSIGDASIVYPGGRILVDVNVGKECVIGPNVVQSHNLTNNGRSLRNSKL